ncbi:MAG: SDR family NAD(P)-dependent oxidoreductase, partial [Marinobacter sp.]
MTTAKTSRVALVTGGTRGIGEAICRILASEGYQVVTTFRNADRKAQALEWQNHLAKEGLEIDLVQMDVADTQSCETAANELLGRYGRLDVLVNNAGITRDSVMKK